MKVRVRADDFRLVLQHKTALDLCSLKIIERRKRLVGNSLVGERPQALARLQFGRIRRQEEQLDAYAGGSLLYQSAALVTRIVQDDRDWLPRIRACQQPQQLTDRRSGDIREILDREDFVCDGVQGSQDIQALTTRWGFDKQPLHTPEHPQKCPVDKVGGIHE